MTGILLFTKDRPHSLATTLQSIAITNVPVYVIDDSAVEESYGANAAIISQYINVKRVTNAVFEKFINVNAIDKIKAAGFLRKPGLIEWNLGYVRNFGLLFAKALGFKKILLVDDDITLTSADTIPKLFAHLADYDFAGSLVTGQEDHSIIGHIAKEAAIEEAALPSGGFIAFEPDTIKHYFLNSYNEDWIWQLLNSPRRKFIITGTVVQLYKEQFSGYQQRVLFQETGEIIVDAIQDELNTRRSISEEKLLTSLVNLQFWTRAISERIAYLRYLQSMVKTAGRKEIIDFILQGHAVYTAEKLVEIFENYTSSLAYFRQIYNKVQLNPAAI